MNFCAGIHTDCEDKCPEHCIVEHGDARCIKIDGQI